MYQFISFYMWEMYLNRIRVRKKFYLQSEDHVESIAGEPGGRVGVLSHGQRLASHPEDEPPELHQREAVVEGPDGEQQLAYRYTKNSVALGLNGS